ncbi:MAG TPA: tRNA lysidine(34) synthetase TilS [Chitinophagaceae bacterium]|nr:tRNA lysidine(34) synthetase TilS [Chitinophagaceae bacterium]
MSLSERFKNIVIKSNLFSAKDKLLLAVSGGVDSIVLCELCKQAGYDFIMAHCNFQLRGEESERDEQFVRKLGTKYDVEVMVKKFDTEKYATKNKISIQEAARELRYSWFNELLTPDSRLPTPDFLLTAHHADDNNETLLMNFFRGTGLHGLTGIPVSAGYIRRPLLSFSKEELIAFAKENKLEFVEDSSNQSSKYTRNFFRNEIIPAISKAYPQVKENLQDNINRFKEIEKLYRFSVGELKKKVCKQKGNEVHVPVKQLMAFNNRALIYEIISPFGFQEKQVDELIKLAGSESGKYIQSPEGPYRIIKHRHWFIICSPSPAESENIIIEKEDKEILFSEGKLRIEVTSNQQPATSNHIACLDLKEIAFPLLLRKWKTGDYFYPLGMKKKKKLSRFFIDQKLSKMEKEKVWVIESANRIIWVVGHRIDERYKVAEKTKQVLQFSLSS